MLSLKTLSRSRSETQSHLSTQHSTETQSHLSTQHRTPRQTKRACERTKTSVRHGTETPLRSSVPSLTVATTTKIVVAHHRIIGTMQAHLRSCIVPENNSWLWWIFAVRAAKIQEAFCACDFGSHCRKRLRCFCNNCGCFCNSCPLVFLGSSASSSSSS